MSQRKIEVFLDDPSTHPDGDEDIDIVATALSMVKGVAYVGPLIETEPETDANNDALTQLALLLDEAGLKVTFDPARNNTVCQHCKAKAAPGKSWSTPYPGRHREDWERICNRCWEHWNTAGELP